MMRSTAVGDLLHLNNIRLRQMVEVGNMDTTKNRPHCGLECVRITILYKEQCSDYQWSASQGR